MDSRRRIPVTSRGLAHATLPACVLACALGVSSPARACCDDVWSCLGAVATAGMSCAVEEAVRAVEAFRAEVTRIRDDGSARMSAAEAEQERMAQSAKDAARQQAQTAEEQVADAQRQMQSAAGAARQSAPAQSPGGAAVASPAAAKLRAPGAAAPRAVKAPLAARAAANNARALSQAASAPKADPVHEQQALRSAQREMQQLAREVQRADKRQLDKAVSKLDRRRRANVRRMNAVLTASFVAPLGGLIAALPPDPLIAAGMIAAMLVTLDKIRGELESKVQPEADRLAAEAAEDMAQMQDALGHMQQSASRSQRIAELAKRLRVSHLQSDLTALQGELGTGAKTVGLVRGPSAGTVGARAGAARPTATPAATSAATMRAAPAHAAARAKPAPKLGASLTTTMPKAAAALKTDLARRITALQQLKLPARIEPVTLQPALAKQLEALYAGKSPAEVRKERKRLLAEAETRFAKYPKTLATVKALIRKPPKVEK